MTEQIKELSKDLGFKDEKRYEYRANNLFSNLDLNNKKVLDVGCGKGPWAIWCGMKGASYSLGIEPEFDGATSGTFTKFKSILEKYDFIQNVHADKLAFEQINENQKFDIAIFYNVINHLNETAVVDLHKNKEHREAYKKIISQMKNILNDDGMVIITDCAKDNYWNKLGLTPPLAKTIEWDKHQNPEEWIGLFKECGFELDHFKYISLYPLRHIENNFLVNKLTTSHFVLRFKRSN